VVAAKIHLLAGPGRCEDVQRLVEHLAPQPAVELLAALRELPGETVATHAEVEAEMPAAEPIERCRLHSDLDRPASRQRCDHQAEPYPLGLPPPPRPA
jgi:hypothetical protein